ncbi:MAG: hypothetical protein ACRDHN_21795 [Thermomicrobiales bacterium]
MLRFRRCVGFAIIVWLAVAGLPLSAVAFPSNTHANPWLITPPPSCPVTIPNNEPPPGREDELNWHHHGSLWVALTRNGVDAMGSHQVNPDGSLWNKMVWVRESVDMPIYVEGVLVTDLSVKAVIDIAPAPSQRFVALQAMGITYPRPGCWAVTATFGYEQVSVFIWVTTVYPVRTE